MGRRSRKGGTTDMTASAAQQKKFDTFVKRVDRKLLLELAVETIIAAETAHATWP